MILCWLLFPMVLAVVALGCGLVVEILAGRRLPGTLLLPAGYALLVVVAQLPAQSDGTAELVVPLAAGLTVVGLAQGADRLRALRPDGWAAAAALVVFAAYAAPVVLSGEPTITGYIRLDDTASWLGIADHVLSHGTSLAGLEPSSYEAMLDFYLGSDYPLGGLLPLGIAGRLSGQDLAWVWQPHLAFLAALLALGLWEVTRTAIASRPARAAAVVVAAQAASLFAYTAWGGFKELATAALLPAVAVLAAGAARDRVTPRDLLPLAVVCAAVLGALSVGGALWLLPVLLPVLVAIARRLGVRAAAMRASFVALLVVVMSLPAVLHTGFLDAPAASTITTQDRLANLIQPLSFLQVFGIWPAGDFRLRPEREDVTYVLVAVVAGAAAWGLVAAWRAGSRRLPLYAGGAFAAAVVICAFGSPWVDAKALAIAAPAPVLAAGAAAAALLAGGRRVEAGVLAAAVAGGVVWSNVLAYRDVTLAPHDRFAELAAINDRFAGDGPTLMTEFEPYGARYLLRDMAPEVAGELRRRTIPLRDGRQVAKGTTADIDAFSLRAVLAYRTLVLRRSPVASRPPSPYRRVRRGRFYEVWQRAPVPEAAIVDRLPLGGRASAGATPACEDVERLARAAGDGGLLLAATARAPAVARVGAATPPGAWSAAGDGAQAFRPHAEGRLDGTVDVPVGGRYEVWVPGATRSRLTVTVDGRPAGSARAELSYRGQFMRLGTLALPAGSHAVGVRYAGPDAAPGSAGSQFAVGPPVLSLDAPRPAIRSVTPARARALCGRTLDWVDAVRLG